VAFASGASDLVPGDTNDLCDVFLHDRHTGDTVRISVASDGRQGNGDSNEPSVSADGRYVAFESASAHLVPGDYDKLADIFVHDRQTGQTEGVLVASHGTEGNLESEEPSISADGRYVAFWSFSNNLVPGDTNQLRDVFVHDRQTGETSRVSVASDAEEGDSWSMSPSISADGRYVAFTSDATNLVPGDTNDGEDVFVHDRQTGQTVRISVASDGRQGHLGYDQPSISADGRYVAFDSFATDLVPGDTNSKCDVFVHDRQTGEKVRISVASDGGQGNLSAGQPSISADGRYVAFQSRASNLVPGDTNSKNDVFLHDRQTGETVRVSVASDGTEGNRDSDEPSISDDGRYVAFVSSASNLVPDDTNDDEDIFVHDRETGETVRISVSSQGAQTD
jgi:Tol biopolymer transport system component